MKKFQILLLLLTVGSLILYACKKDETTQNASVQFRLTDAPGAFDAVYIDIQQIEIKAGPNSQLITLARPGIYNLLDFTNGLDTLMANVSLSPGRLSQIRLILGNNNSVVVDGISHALATPSAQQSGLKLTVQYDLEPGVSYAYSIDFDAGRSIVLHGNGTYSLKPVVRMNSMAVNGAIRGNIDPDSAAVYVMAISGTDTFGTIPKPSGAFLLGHLASGNYQVVVEGRGSLGNLTINNVGVVVGNITELGVITF
jgi:hypothetical protein